MNTKILSTKSGTILIATIPGAPIIGLFVDKYESKGYLTSKN